MAEIGINHNGEMSLAKKLILAAADIGVDGVKFQKRTIEEMYSKLFLDKEYQNVNSFGRTYGEHKKFLEFTNEQIIELNEYADQHNVDFVVSGFDFTGFDFIDSRLDVLFHKIPSPLVTHLPLLKHISLFHKPIILSTGMHNHVEVKEAVDLIRSNNPDLIVLQCTTQYPTKNKDANLNIIKTYREKLQVLAGYSSHDDGIIIPASSIAYGSCFIEKHFTLDKSMRGPDHRASLEPNEMQRLIQYIRILEEAAGSGEKRISESERQARIKYNYSCVAKRPILKGEIITASNIDFKVPCNGFCPSEIEMILNKRALRNIGQDESINLSNVR
jgi:sialic acid synthase SpsE